MRRLRIAERYLFERTTDGATSVCGREWPPKPDRPAVRTRQILGHTAMAPPWNPPVLSGQKRNYLERNVETQSNRIDHTPIPPRSLPAPRSPPRHLRPPSRAPAIASSDQATIGKGLFIKGEINGSESLFIDGKVEGSINLPGNRVTVGRNGQVAASITAREIVVLGKVRGNVTASDRVDIRAEGSLSGDVTAARISIEDGAFFKGGIDIRKPERKPVQWSARPRPRHPSWPRLAAFLNLLKHSASALAGALVLFGGAARRARRNWRALR